MTLSQVIEAVSVSDLRRELRGRKVLTHFRGLSIYEFSGEECPALMNEVGRLREVIFRNAGAGRGLEKDIDSLDFGAHSYRQLIAWDEKRGQFVGLLRFQFGSVALTEGKERLRTSSLFDYSEAFQKDILPRSIELGRSVVSPSARLSPLGLFALWRGLAALVHRNPAITYFFGNVTIYSDYPTEARDTLIRQTERLYAPPSPFLLAKSGLRLNPEACEEESRHVDSALRSASTAKEKLHVLSDVVSGAGARIPSILHSYLMLSENVFCGQCAQDADFADAHELGIIVPLKELDPRARRLFALDVRHR